MANPPKDSFKEQHLDSVLLGFGVRVRRANGSIYVKLRWGRITIALLVFAVLFWFSFFSVAYLVRRNNYPNISFWKTQMLPFRIAEDRKERGNYQIGAGIELFESLPGLSQKGVSQKIIQDKFAQAFGLISTGLGRAPENLEGRVFLSDIMSQQFNRPDRAADILKDGIKYGKNDIQYVTKTLKTLSTLNENESVVEIAQDILKTSEDKLIRNQAAFFLATSYNYMSDFDEAESILEKYELTKIPEGIILYSSVLWDKGEKQQSIAQLKAISAELDKMLRLKNTDPRFDATVESRIKERQSIVYGLLSKRYGELDDYDNAIFYAQMRYAIAPENYQSSVDLISALLKAKKTQEAQPIINEFFRKFVPNSKDSFSQENRMTAIQSLSALIDTAANNGNLSLAKRIYTEMLCSEMPMSNASLMLLSAFIVSKDYNGAIRYSEDITSENPNWLKPVEVTFSGLQAVAYYGAKDFQKGDVYLNQFKAVSNLRIQAVTTVSRQLRNIGAYEQARALLLEAYRRNNTRQELISELVRVDAQLGIVDNLPNYIRVLLKARRPSSEVVLMAYDNFSSDRCLFVPGRDSLLGELETFLKNRKLL